MRVGLLNSEYPVPAGHGGIATYTYTLANALAVSGHKVTLLVRKGTVPDPLDERIALKEYGTAPVRGLRQSLWRRGFPEIAHERCCSQAARLLFDYVQLTEGLDVVEIPDYNGQAALFDHCAYKVVVRLHTAAFCVDRLNGVRPGFRRKMWYRLEGAGLRRARAIASPSKALRRMTADFYGLPEESMAVIPYPVDASLFSSGKPREPGAEIRILYAGRLEKRKGLDTLAAALPGLLQEHGTVSVTLAGADAGPEGAAYRKRLAEAAGEHSGRVAFLGALPRTALPDVYRRADIFVIPSLFDNAPNALFEAMASGLPCVGSDTGGINEIIDAGRNGLLFRTNDAADLRAKLGSLIADAGLRQRLGRAARLDIETNYEPRKIASRMADLYAGTRE